MYDYKQFLVRKLDKSNLWTNEDGCATNPGMIEYQGDVWFCYRAGTQYWKTTDIVIGKLNRETWLPDGQFSRIRFSELMGQGYSVEDPRLLIHKGRLFVQVVVVKFDVHDRTIKWTRLGLIEYDTLELKILHYSEQKQQMEKNWVFFSHDDDIYCTHSMFDGRHSVCKVIDNVAYPAYYTAYDCARWQTGNVMRGTSNLVLRDGLLWGVAHTNIVSEDIVKASGHNMGMLSNYLGRCAKLTVGSDPNQKKKSIHYQGIFYAMNPEPPFNIIYMQRSGMLSTGMDRIDIGSNTMYMHHFFPSGLISVGDDWVIGAGVHERSIAIIRVPHRLVLEYLRQTSWYP